MSETINPNVRAIQQDQDVYINYVTKYGETPAQVEKLATYDNLNPTLYVFSIKESDIPTLTYDGATFCGWYTTETYDEGTKVEVGTFEFDNGTISITFYAKWSITVKTAMTNIANPIRNLLNTTNTLTIDNMNTNLDTTIAAVSDIKAALTEKGIDASGATSISDINTLVSGIAGKYPNGTSWTQSVLNDGTNNSCAYANGIWVMCSGSGLYYSNDGMTWIESNITTGSFYHCVHANGIWVACANNYGLYYSTDGKTWTQSNITSDNFYHCAHANGIWIACGYSQNGIYYSSNGKTWNRDTGTLKYGSYNHVVYANGIWIVGSNSANGLYYSVDGITWVQSNITGGNFYYCENANGIWVECSLYKGLYYSTDGKTWTQSNITNGIFYHCANANGIWVACGNTGLYYSTDGKTWTQSNITGGGFNYCNNANGIWIACGDGIYYSTDGKTWTISNIDSSYSTGCCLNANGIWVACGHNRMYSSITWK